VVVLGGVLVALKPQAAQAGANQDEPGVLAGSRPQVLPLT